VICVLSPGIDLVPVLIMFSGIPQSNLVSVATPASSGFGDTVVSPVIPAHVPHSVKAVVFDQRLTFLKKYGSSFLAYSSLQEGLDYYMQPDCGYIPYSLIGKDNTVPVCLGDPICPADRSQEIIKNFLERYDYPVFFHITNDMAHILSEMGFSVNEIGTEIVVDLQRFTLTGNKMRFLRKQIHKGRRDGLVVKEQLCSEVGEDVLKAISEQWLHKKVVHNQELSFVVRPVVYGDEMDVRIFIAYKDDCAVGFNIFDPIYRGGQIIGYVPNHLRATNEGNYSIQDWISFEAMRVFKQEGKEILSLGFCPLYKINDSGEFRYSRLLKTMFQFAYEHANYVYKFKALAFHKSRYRPGLDGCQETKVYCAYKNPARFSLLPEIVSLMGINVVEQIVGRLTGR